ncbi:hypothetical protein B296_00053819 [Ensete ventricosum]|uniref:DUF834 domain-containing protein n=1 Tax=Ensete ventricosum TaxID=4639 RepID=A0A426XF96_ENSVE|nr:hypothetical protein B296_00053819 [Ensete ventricosum]
MSAHWYRPLSLSHDGEEEWATVTRLRAGRQQRQRRRQQLWPVMAAAAEKRLGNGRSGSCSGGDVAVREWAAVADLIWSRGRGSNDDKQGSSNGGGGLRGSQGKMGWEAEGKWPTEEEATEGRKGRGGLGCSEEGLGYGRSDWEEKEAAGSGEGCSSGRAAGSDEEAREEGEEGAVGVAAEEGYGRLEARGEGNGRGRQREKEGRWQGWPAAVAGRGGIEMAGGGRGG